MGSRQTYDALRTSLQDSPEDLAVIRTFQAESGLAPDDAAWESFALAFMAVRAALSTDALKARLDKATETFATLPDAMRSAGMEIVRGLADDIAGATSVAIADGTKAELALIIADGIAKLAKIAEEAKTKNTDTAKAFRDSAAVGVANITTAAGEIKVAADYLHEKSVHLDAVLSAHAKKAWISYVLIAIISMGAAGFGVYSYDRSHLYMQGYIAGAHAERVHQGGN